MSARSTIVALLALLAVAATACGGGDGVTVENVRARTALASTGTGAVYLDLVNDTDAPIELVRASVASDIAGVVELHETVTAEGNGMSEDGGMAGSESEGMAPGDDASEGMEGMGGMTMRQVQSIPVPAGGAVSLEPGGLHIMLLELARDLEDGDEFEVELEFSDGSTRTVTAVVSADV